mgnify:CR=1 FL=1|jgi:hypothetical protein
MNRICGERQNQLAELFLACRETRIHRRYSVLIIFESYADADLRSRTLAFGDELTRQLITKFQRPRTREKRSAAVVGKIQPVLTTFLKS